MSAVYREQGAAVERVAQLEEENRELRARVDELSRLCSKLERTRASLCESAAFCVDDLAKLLRRD